MFSLCLLVALLCGVLLGHGLRHRQARRESARRMAEFQEKLGLAHRDADEKTQRLRAAQDRIALLDRLQAQLLERDHQLAVLNVELARARRDAQEAPPADGPDDLQRIRGIGVRMEQLLNARGVARFEQIATWTGQDVDRFEAELPGSKGRIRRENWVAAALLEHRRKYGRDP